MDISTLIGLIVGISLISFAIIQKSNSFGYFWDYPSLLLVLGGTIAATFINYPLKNIWNVFKVLAKVFTQTRFGYQEVIDQFADLASKARKKGLVSLESDLKHISDNFMKSSIELAISERDATRLANYLHLELSNMRKRHSIGQELFFYMGTYAPAFGMVGTIVGLIVMMNKFNEGEPTDSLTNMASSFSFDISTQFQELLGGMGMALLTTFYGLILANLLFIPIGGKLKRRSDEEIMLKEIMIEGVLCLHNRDHPLVVREKLNTFVPQLERREEEER